MKCPACKDPVLVIAEREGIEIDYCPECRGVWLDRGELDKIIERAGQSMPTPERQVSRQHDRGPDDRRDFDDDDDDDRGGRGRKQRGFLGNLFDFD